MPLGPLGVTAVLAALDWGAWDWAANSSHPTIGLIAGLLMAPIAVAFAWSLIRVLLALARIALVRAGAQPPLPAPRVRIESRSAGRPFDIEAQEDRLAA
ncbi:MAG TPA: hypothetical protein VHX66_11895 [Solirubrobacteraceae bacterium]|jgi:TRAP-type C4-dicarboxylate transport system permease small subunit|nr:hypothetical protein [Solirubrobacteraceae bacterium]